MVIFGRDEMHLLTDECSGSHCRFHGRDELGAEVFLRCGECWHAFKDRPTLYRVFRWELFKGYVRQRDFRGIFRNWLSETDFVYFCPFCLHDFF